jgi:DNA-binding transcriptional LysR family regulator
MTLRQLRYVLAVADAGSFTRAAEEEHVSQPSLSQQVATLEAELGGPLFVRPPGPVTLTAAGEALVPQARMAVAAADRAVEASRCALGLATPRLGVCAVRSLAALILPDCLRRWRELRPEVVIDLHEVDDRAHAARAVRTGSVDVGLAPRSPSWEGARQPLGWDELVAVLPPGDPLLRSEGSIDLGAVADRDWVLYEHGHVLAATVVDACELAGFTPRPVVHTARVEAAVELAAAGIGPALVPTNAVPSNLLHASRPLSPPVVWEIDAIGAAPEWSDVAADFLDAVRRTSWWGRPDAPAPAASPAAP